MMFEEIFCCAVLCSCLGLGGAQSFGERLIKERHLSKRNIHLKLIQVLNDCYFRLESGLCVRDWLNEYLEIAVINPLYILLYTKSKLIRPRTKYTYFSVLRKRKFIKWTTNVLKGALKTNFSLLGKTFGSHLLCIFLG